jgi:alpha-galactosidase
MPRALLLLALLVSAPSLAAAAAVTPDEMAQARRWAAARFEGAPEAGPTAPGLTVVANHNAISKNSRNGKPLKIADAEFTRGLYCHAPSKVLVRLPGPAKTFAAVVGVDSNDQTRPGRGSVIFSVTAAGKERFRSAVTREGMAGVPVSADLDGATELVLEVSDAGDGISCDQSDWADARAVLADGSTVWLGDLPISEGPCRQFAAEPPFSFTYGGRPSAELLKTWDAKQDSRKLDDQRTEHTLAWTDPKSGLLVRCVGVTYDDFPTVEWTLYFKNTGTADTPILADIQAIDMTVDRPAKGDFLLHHGAGSQANRNDYALRETPLAPGAVKRISAAGGRATNTDLSYFNLEWGGEGMIVAVGWPGQWAAEFTRDSATGVRLRAGQELTRLKLLPGEEIRTPLIVLQFWKGKDWIDAQNVWRRWMMAHSMPRPYGKLPAPMLLASSSRAYGEMIGANEANQIMHIDRYLEEGIKLDYWWMDAGWYIQEKGWPQVGTWELDPKRFPKGFKPISDYAHSKGIKILVWFEPERVAEGTWLAEKHPEWVLGGKKGGILNLGNPEAWKWLVEHIDRLITEQGIDLYRQDFNTDPLGHWRANDAPDRQGITENKHITGYLAYWDELRRRHPDMLIDSCASGGRRNDIETMRRAVPLWRSDHAYDSAANQGMTYGLSLWLPYHGTGTVGRSGASYYGEGRTPVEPYAFWSDVTPSLGCGFDVRIRDLDYAAWRRLIDQWRSITPYYFGDFYPLTPYSVEGAVWIAWQFDRPDLGEGMVQAFRRTESPYELARLKLRGLDAGAKYVLTRLDAPGETEVTGRELMQNGLPVSMTDRPGAAVIIYKRQKSR